MRTHLVKLMGHGRSAEIEIHRWRPRSGQICTALVTALGAATAGISEAHALDPEQGSMHVAGTIWETKESRSATDSSASGRSSDCIARPIPAQIENSAALPNSTSGVAVRDVVALLKTAAEGLPDNGGVQYHLGMGLKRLGQNDLAAATLQTAISLCATLTPDRLEGARSALEQLTRAESAAKPS